MTSVAYVLGAVLAATLVFAGRALVPRRWGMPESEALAVGAVGTVLLVAVLAPALAAAPLLHAPLLAALVVATAVAFRRGVLRPSLTSEGADARIIVALFVAQALCKAALSLAWEFPAQGGDWFIHGVSLPAAFARGEWAAPSERTGLFSLVLLATHEATGVPVVGYWLSQLVSVSLNSLYVIPAFLLARRFFGRRAALSCALLLSVNFFLWYQALYTWPKNLATFFILLAFYLVTCRDRPTARELAIAGIALGGGFLSHPLAAFYVLPLGLVLLWRGRVIARPWPVLWLSALLTVLPQFVWSHVTRGGVGSSRMIYYPLVLRSWEEAYRYDANTLIARFHAAPWSTVLGNRVYSLMATLTNVSGLSPVRVYLGFYDSLWTALGGPLFLAAVLGLVRVVRGSGGPRDFVLYAVGLPLLLLTLFTGWPTGMLGGLGLHPVLVLLVVFATGYVRDLKDERLWRWGMAVAVGVSLVDGFGQWLGLQTFYYLNEAASNWASLGKSGPHFVPGFELGQLRSAHYFVAGAVGQVASVCLLGAMSLAVARWARGYPLGAEG